MEISVDLVLTLLQTLDPKKSTGPDGLFARFLRDVAAEIATLLTNLYNPSLSCGKFCLIGNIHTSHQFIKVAIWRIQVISVLLLWCLSWPRS